MRTNSQQVRAAAKLYGKNGQWKHHTKASDWCYDPKKVACRGVFKEYTPRAGQVRRV